MNRLPTTIALTAALLVIGTGAPVLAQTAHYRVTFDATWTAETHPEDFPPDPHFSGLVGGTHDESVAFWRDGELASLGIQRMAEWGSQADLLAEIQDAIDAGSAAGTIAGVPLWTVPGSTSVEFSMEPGFALVTLVTMIAPSPDWFVGVAGLDLAPGGQWVDELVVELFPWDAGTDSGSRYTSGDQVTFPPEPIFPITAGPFTAGVPLGTFTFTKLFVADAPPTPAVSVTVYPNPFNPRTTIAWELPRTGRMTLEIFDLKGRRVRTLWDEETAAGPGRVAWDGLDRRGRPLASGQYRYRLGFEKKFIVGSLIMLR